MSFIKNIIISRLFEASTIRGIILLIGSVSGLAFFSENTEYIIAITMGLAGVFGLLPDNLSRKQLINKVEEQEDEPIHQVLYNGKSEEPINKGQGQLADDPAVVVPKPNSIQWERLHNQ